MTRSTSTPPLVAEDLEAATDLLRAHGHRVSAARRLVLTALFAADAPVSADEIVSGLDGRLPESEITSVYRNLETFEKLGLVRHVHLGHGPSRYRLAQPSEETFVVCERCERVEVVDVGALKRVRTSVARELGYDASFAHFPIVGLCPDCAAARAKAT